MIAQLLRYALRQRFITVLAGLTLIGAGLWAFSQLKIEARAALPDAVSVWGSQDLEERERRIVSFGDGGYRVLSTKPVIAGSGCNFQRHCHREIFAGIVPFWFAMMVCIAILIVFPEIALIIPRTMIQ